MWKIDYSVLASGSDVVETVVEDVVEDEALNIAVVLTILLVVVEVVLVAAEVVVWIPLLSPPVIADVTVETTTYGVVDCGVNLVEWLGFGFEFGPLLLLWVFGWFG